MRPLSWILDALVFLQFEEQKGHVSEEQVMRVMMKKLKNQLAKVDAADEAGKKPPEVLVFQSQLLEKYL
ncbi:unnamed protein product [Microthlaspi erraticum]|uniref:Uncharacterized protein n=1 Tax=Microthlaspi erraticum TaxID=1685480 RepID=A0A6D2I3N1_9BRAS|nr:unnamed protein product [Microthlaspi erraticum]